MLVESSLRTRTRVAYSFASLGTGSFLIVPQMFLLFFMTEHLGISAALASLTLLLPKVWEFLSDPYIGMRSDHTRSRWGRRHPFMLVGALSLSLGLALAFNVPQLATPVQRWIYVTAMFVLATTGYALFSVPYTALLAEMTASRQERTRLVALRMGFLGVGLLIAAIGWPEVIKAMQGTRQAYEIIGWSVGAVCAVAMMITVFGTLGVRQYGAASEAKSLRLELRTVLREPAFIALALAYGLQMLAQSANTSMLAYVGKYISPLGADFMLVCFGVMTLVSIVAMAMWTLVARWLSKRRCFMLGSALGAAGYLLATIGLEGPVWMLVTGSALAGIGFSAGQVFGFSLLPDVIDQARARNGMNREGIFTGVWVGWEKIGLALGPTLAGQALGLTGFAASAGESVGQTPAALSMVVTMFGYVPAALMLAAVLPLLSRSLRAVDERQFEYRLEQGVAADRQDRIAGFGKASE